MKNSTYVLNNTTLSGNIKYTSIFTYKLYAGDCNLKESSWIPYGIAIPLSSLKNGKGDDSTFIYWPYEGQPIWEGFPDFKNWLSKNNDGSWINTFNECDSIQSGGLKWKASLLVRGASCSEMTLPDVEEYSSEVVNATQKSQNSKKINQIVTNAELQ